MPHKNPSDFKPGEGGSEIHIKTGAIYKRSNTGHRNKKVDGGEWKIWPGGTKGNGFGEISAKKGNRITVDNEGNVLSH